MFKPLFVDAVFCMFKMETQDEVAALQKESELPIEQLIENLPKEILEKPASIHSGSEEEVEDLPKKVSDKLPCSHLSVQ